MLWYVAAIKNDPIIIVTYLIPQLQISFRIKGIRTITIYFQKMFAVTRATWKCLYFWVK